MSASPLTRGATLGRYTILWPVERGGMGEVFAAFDTELDRKAYARLGDATHGAPARAWLTARQSPRQAR